MKIVAVVLRLQLWLSCCAILHAKLYSHRDWKIAMQSEYEWVGIITIVHTLIKHNINLSFPYMQVRQVGIFQAGIEH